MNRYVFGYLIKYCRLGCPLYDPGQIGIEVGVPQPPGYIKKGVLRDVVIWGKTMSRVGTHNGAQSIILWPSLSGKCIVPGIANEKLSKNASGFVATVVGRTIRWDTLWKSTWIKPPLFSAAVALVEIGGSCLARTDRH